MVIFSRYTWWVAAMVGFALFLTIAGQVGVLSPFQGATLRVTAPVDGALTWFFEPVASFLSSAGNVDETRDENSRLRLENEELRNQLTGLQQYDDRVKELEAALNIQGEAGQTKVAANIVHRSNLAFTATVSIDKGSSSGIKKGMVVVSAQGSLMGTVTDVFSDSAFVRLVTDTRSKVNAQAIDSNADGSVQGTADRGLILDKAQADIKVGDIVVTSGLGGNYPAGIPIGTVSEVSGTTQDIFRKVKVEPHVRIGTAKTVLVLTSFLPQRLSIEDGE